MTTHVKTVTHEQAVAHAHALIPVLHTRAARAEGLRRQPEETIADLERLGLTRLLVPRRFGGAGLRLRTMIEIPQILARADPAAGWTIATHLLHCEMLTFFSEQAQQEVWTEHPDAFIATSSSPNLARQVEGGIVLNGLWHWASNIGASSWIIVFTQVPEASGALAARFCLVPRWQGTILDDWQVVGMRGTGSNSVQFNEVFVPATRTVSLEQLHTKHQDGEQAHLPFFAIANLPYLATLLGTVQGAYEIWRHQSTEAVSTLGGRTIARLSHVQILVGELASTLEILSDQLRGIVARLEKQGSFDRAATIRLLGSTAWLGKQAVQVLEQLFQASGARALHEQSPIQRFWRDGHAIAMHPSLSAPGAFERLGCLELGQPLPAGQFV